MAKADIWMPLYIGDYLADTMHLTTEQHGAYLLLIMAYWKNGGPLTGNDSALASICRLSGDAWSNARAMLEPFFVIDPASGSWRHERIEKEMANATESKERRVSKAKAAAEARWNKDAASNASSMPQAMLKECPSPSPSHSKEEVPNGTCDQRAESPEKVERIPYQEILTAFQEKLPGLPQPRDLSDARKKHIRSIWSRKPSHGSVDFFARYFEYVSESDFLMGRTRQPWTACCFDWLIKPANFLKVIEGNYHGGQENA